MPLTAARVLDRVWPILGGIGFLFVSLYTQSHAAGGSLTPLPAQLDPITPIPSRTDLDARKVALGERLFHDPRLSSSGHTSCATCHPLASGGTDHQSHVVSVGGKEVRLATLSVFNSDLLYRKGWLGSADSFATLLESKLADRNVMNNQWSNIERVLKQDSTYGVSFRAIYDAAPDAATMSNALREFVRSLITPDSRFDRYLRGDDTALSPEEKEGFEEFKSHGCIACHQGVGVGGNVFQRLGVFEDYFALRDHDQPADQGRRLVTGRERDLHVFRVPSLRNVAVTGPYFHDGSATTLDDAVRIMMRFQLGQQPLERDATLIVKFLRTLTGHYQGRSL